MEIGTYFYFLLLFCFEQINETVTKLFLESEDVSFIFIEDFKSSTFCRENNLLWVKNFHTHQAVLRKILDFFEHRQFCQLCYLIDNLSTIQNTTLTSHSIFLPRPEPSTGSLYPIPLPTSSTHSLHPIPLPAPSTHYLDPLLPPNYKPKPSTQQYSISLLFY